MDTTPDPTRAGLPRRDPLTNPFALRDLTDPTTASCTRCGRRGPIDDPELIAHSDVAGADLAGTCAHCNGPVELAVTETIQRHLMTWAVPVAGVTAIIAAAVPGEDGQHAAEPSNVAGAPGSLAPIEFRWHRDDPWAVKLTFTSSVTPCMWMTDRDYLLALLRGADEVGHGNLRWSQAGTVPPGADLLRLTLYTSDMGAQEFLLFAGPVRAFLAHTAAILAPGAEDPAALIDLELATLLRATGA